MGRSVTRSGPFRAIRTGAWPGVEAPPAGQSGAEPAQTGPIGPNQVLQRRGLGGG